MTNQSSVQVLLCTWMTYALNDSFNLFTVLLNILNVIYNNNDKK